MIAIGRDGENVVFFGSSSDGSLVQFRCNLNEAESALWQLKAMLGHDPEQANRRMTALEHAVAGLRSELATMLALPQREPGPDSARPIPAPIAFYGPVPGLGGRPAPGLAPMQGGIVTMAATLEDAAREAEERDRREIEARRNVEATRHAIARPAPNPEEASRQEARRLRVLAASAGGDDGDE